MNKERQSVYEKALVISHEDEKELSVTQQKLDQHKLQRYIDYKLEERKLRTELIQLKREQIQLAKEAKQREKQRKTVDDIAKELNKSKRFNGHTAAKVEKKLSLPQAACTQGNVSRILRRSLSYESEYFTWTVGLPKIENASSKPQGTGKVEANNARKDSETAECSEGNDGLKAQERASLKTSDILYSVPITESALPRKRKSTSVSRRENEKLPSIGEPASIIASKSKRDKSPKQRLKLPSI